MKYKLSFRKILQILFCILTVIGAAGIIPYAFSDSVYGGIGVILIILINIGLILISIFHLGNRFHKLLFSVAFIAFVAVVYFSPSFLETENIFTLLLVFSGFMVWLTYVGLKYFFSLFLLPFRIIGFLLKKTDKKKGALTGIKWVCDNAVELPNGRIHVCGQKTVTFKNGIPSPSATKGCDFSEDGEHHFVPVDSERDINSSIGHAIEWIGVAIGIISAFACFVMKLIK